MVTRKLGPLYSKFLVRTERLSNAFFAPLPQDSKEAAACQFIHAAGDVQIVNRLLVLWGEYCRNLVIQSASGDALTLQGNKLSTPPGISGFSDVKAKLGANISSGPSTRWDEPSWALDRARQLAPSNFEQINLGVGSAPVSQLKALRNYLVHPNEHTKGRYLNLAIQLDYPGMQPKELLKSRLPMGPTVFESWIADFQIAAYNAAL
jgi:hypothetical protein